MKEYKLFKYSNRLIWNVCSPYPWTESSIASWIDYNKELCELKASFSVQDNHVNISVEEIEAEYYNEVEEKIKEVCKSHIIAMSLYYDKDKKFCNFLIEKGWELFSELIEKGWELSSEDEDDDCLNMILVRYLAEYMPQKSNMSSKRALIKALRFYKDKDKKQKWNTACMCFVSDNHHLLSDDEITYIKNYAINLDERSK